MSKNFVAVSFSFFLIISFIAISSPWRSLYVWGQIQAEYSVADAFPNLTFNTPVGIVSPNDNTNRLFVIEQHGTIRVFQNSATTTSSTVFLDISDRVLYGGEQGLLGLAFHPDYATNGFFYVDYVTDSPRRTIIARYSVSTSDPNVADPNSEQILLTINQPYENHNGGQLAFGPDGFLYIGMGDGGSGGDPLGNGQNRSVLLGKILRIDVDSPASGLNYGIPADNPFAGNTMGYKEEIFAYGFRNPWRFSFDSTNGTLWVGDVGQSQREEIDIVENGKNYGWNIMEGTLTYSSGSQAGLELPVWEYSHAEGNAIIGGYVYHGTALIELMNAYVYGDYGTGKIWALTLSGTGVPTNTLLNDTSLNISSFGVDINQELFFCALDGKIYKLTENAIPEFSSLAAFVVLLTATLLAALAFRKRDVHVG